MNIAVDMTPYIAGGANGGLVPLLISTIREMVARNEDDITLITTVQNYTDLAFMDGPRVSRCTIDGSRKSWEEEPSMTDEQTAAPPDWTRRVFHKVQAPAKRFLPCRTYNYLKNHKQQGWEPYGLERTIFYCFHGCAGTRSNAARRR